MNTKAYRNIIMTRPRITLVIFATIILLPAMGNGQISIIGEFSASSGPVDVIDYESDGILEILVANELIEPGKSMAELDKYEVELFVWIENRANFTRKRKFILKMDALQVESKLILLKSISMPSSLNKFIPYGHIIFFHTEVDLNADGKKESLLIYGRKETSGYDQVALLWMDRGKIFRETLWDFISEVSKVGVVDVDRDGLKELVIIGNSRGASGYLTECKIYKPGLKAQTLTPRKYIKEPQIEKMLGPQVVKVEPSNYLYWSFSLSKGDSLVGYIFLEEYDINVWLLDKREFEAWQKSETFYYYTEASKERIQEFEINFKVPKVGEYYLVLDNRYSWLTSKLVSITVFSVKK